MKLWQKDTASLKEVEVFTVGRDREFDLMLAPFDIIGSIAHVTMLETVGLLTPEEKNNIIAALREIYKTTSLLTSPLSPFSPMWKTFTHRLSCC